MLRGMECSRNSSLSTAQDNMEGKEVARVRKDNPRRKIFDWISEPRPEHITPFQKFTLEVDWEKSPLGPMIHWPAQLRQMVLLVMHDPTPAGEYSQTRFWFPSQYSIQ